LEEKTQFRQSATCLLNEAVLYALNLSYVPSFVTAGIVGGFDSQGGGETASRERDINLNVFSNQADMVQHVFSHPDAINHVVNIIRKNRFQMKI
jgi:hypothetical protein